MRRTKRPTPVAVPQQPPRERFRPAWAKDRPQSVQGTPCHLVSIAHSIERGDFRLPRFQRPWRWSDADTISLLDSLLAGYHAGQLLLWDRHDLPASTDRFGEIEVQAPAGHGRLVVDGQQRLGAIASAVLGRRFYLHLIDGRFATDVTGPWWCPVGLVVIGMRHALDWIQAHAAEHALDEEKVLDAVGAAMDALGYAGMYTVTFEHGWTLDRVVESYRRLNTTGVRMSAEDLEAGLRRAEGR